MADRKLATRSDLSHATSHRTLRPILLVTVAAAAIAVSIPMDRASAFALGNFHLGRVSTPQAVKPQMVKPSGAVISHNTGVGSLGKVNTSDPIRKFQRGGDLPPTGQNYPSGRGHPIMGTNVGEHPQVNGPRPPRGPFPPRPNFTPPVLPPVFVTTPPPVIVNPGPVVNNPTSVIANPAPVNGNPLPAPPLPTLAVKRGGGVPPAGETHYVPDEVVIEVARTMTQQQINALAQRHRLAVLQSFQFQLGGTTLIRGRITDRRTVPVVVQALEADATVLSAQPNYLYSLVAEGTPALASLEGDPSQYILDKMHLPQAHALATGDKVLVAVIDSGIDVKHPDLAGDIAGTFDAIGKGLKVHPHGTAIAGAIAAHGKLMGAAPAAHILAIRAFSGTNDNDGTTIAIANGLNWAVLHGARVVNMSFASPAKDPGIARAVATAYAKGVVLVAATGNSPNGASSGPQYPAFDPEVIAVTATDEHDQMPPFAIRGDYVAVAAPGVDLMLLGPNGTYQMSSGTSFSSAYVSGTAALMIERQPGLTPDALRQALTASAHHLDAKTPTDQFGAGLVDAYQAVVSVSPPMALNAPAPAVTPVSVRP